MKQKLRKLTFGFKLKTAKKSESFRTFKDRVFGQLQKNYPCTKIPSGSFFRRTLLIKPNGLLEPIHLKKHLFSKKGVFCVFRLSVAFTAFASLNQNELPCPRGSFWLSKAKAGKACESQKKQNIETLKYCFFYFSVFQYFAFSGSQRPLQP